MPVESAAGDFTRPASPGTGNTITGLGFEPSVVFFLPSHVVTANSWRAQMGAGIAWAAQNINTTDVQIKSVFVAGDDADATPNAEMAYISGSMFIVSGVGSIQAAAGDVSLDADGFAVSYESSPYDGEQEHIAYLALGGDVLARTGNRTVPTTDLTPGSRFTIAHDLPFQPSGALVLASATATATDEIDVSLGVRGSGIDQWAVSFADEHSADPTDNYRRMSGGEIIHILSTTTGATRFAASVERLTPHGIECVVVANSMTGPSDKLTLRVLYLGGCLVDAAAFARDTGTAPAAQTIPVHGTPKAALFTTTAQVDADTTAAHIRGSLGVSDGTNHRAVAWQWADAATTSSGDTYFSDDHALLVADNATPTVEGASAATFDIGEINLSWDPNN